MILPGFSSGPVERAGRAGSYNRKRLYSPLDYLLQLNLKLYLDINRAIFLGKYQTSRIALI